jgi:hypothetical protein
VRRALCACRPPVELLLGSVWGVLREALSAEERLDQGQEGCLVLEQEGVAGIGVERELGSRDQAGEGKAVGGRVEPVGRAVGDQRGGR